MKQQSPKEIVQSIENRIAVHKEKKDFISVAENVMFLTKCKAYDDFIFGLLDFLTGEKSEYSIMYGNQKHRFADEENEYTIEEMVNIYASTLK